MDIQNNMPLSIYNKRSKMVLCEENIHKHTIVRYTFLPTLLTTLGQYAMSTLFKRITFEMRGCKSNIYKKQEL